MEFYHNPRCGKSRTALKLLNEKGIEPEIREYLKTPPSADEIKSLLKKLGIKAHDLIRTGESIYKENFKGKELSEDQWIKAMADFPILIERPIYIKGDKAVIGRPPENVLDL